MQKASSCLPKLPKAALRQDLCGMNWQNSQADFMSVAEKSTKKGLYNQNASTQKLKNMDGFSSRASCTKEKLLACKGIAREGFLIIEICVRAPFLDMLKSQELFTDLPSFLSARHSRAGPSKSSDYATGLKCLLCVVPGLHKLWYPGIRDRSTWGKFGAHGEHGDVFPFSNLGAL